MRSLALLLTMTLQEAEALKTCIFIDGETESGRQRLGFESMLVFLHDGDRASGVLWIRGF